MTCVPALGYRCLTPLFDTIEALTMPPAGIAEAERMRSLDGPVSFFRGVPA